MKIKLLCLLLCVSSFACKKKLPEPNNRLLGSWETVSQVRKKMSSLDGTALEKRDLAKDEFEFFLMEIEVDRIKFVYNADDFSHPFYKLKTDDQTGIKYIELHLEQRKIQYVVNNNELQLIIPSEGNLSGANPYYYLDEIKLKRITK